MAADTPLALTLGDPAGIGPDITLLAFAARSVEPIPPFVLLGDEGVLAARAEALGLSVPIATVATPREALDVFAEALPVLPVAVPGPVVAGRPDVAAAPAVKQSIEMAVDLVRRGERARRRHQPNRQVPALSGRLHLSRPHGISGGSRRRGTGAAPVMMLVAGPFKAVPVTIHIPLKEVPAQLTADLLLATIRTTDQDLRRYFGFLQPRLAVSGLNPHAGEDGSLGREEIEIIAPAIEAAKAEGIDVKGPYPADTMFHTAARETYDTALCMYHDQALVPFKTLAFEEGVNVTLGLPFVRTSPDHGTAFGIAGTGKANPKSLVEALRLADAMSRSAED
ncbi:4-hydroxythreonine-4-phosphate dehydrogenase PdxA [Methyloceanibacter superfactus]|uniref:4-hydroxythreonine-4-phosphate dehydrogenase PdxA n=1 Tax=Methyloceanibacter superfactus TaxID=1774969 RepID=UPI000A63B8F7|nr:4-hydroxythreonine-4-phosphate dehydrogenase PdxA [Methyloceanibacter superfactus]